MCAFLPISPNTNIPITHTHTHSNKLAHINTLSDPRQLSPALGQVGEGEENVRGRAAGGQGRTVVRSKE